MKIIIRVLSFAALVVAAAVLVLTLRHTLFAEKGTRLEVPLQRHVLAPSSRPVLLQQEIAMTNYYTLMYTGVVSIGKQE